MCDMGDGSLAEGPPRSERPRGSGPHPPPRPRGPGTTPLGPAPLISFNLVRVSRRKSPEAAGSLHESRQNGAGGGGIAHPTEHSLSHSQTIFVFRMYRCTEVARREVAWIWNHLGEFNISKPPRYAGPDPQGGPSPTKVRHLRGSDHTQWADVQ